MNHGFWSSLPRPFFVLAPMSGVTDVAYRRIIACYGRPDVTWTEFVSANALVSPGRKGVIHDLWYSEAERPIVAQLYGAKPDNFRGAAQLCVELGFNGIDLNMGCPAKDVEKRGAGAALIRTPQLAREVIAATQDGAGALPVSVKTRIGYRCNEIDDWLGTLIEARPAAITIHARTRNEMSKVPARWDVVAQAVALAGSPSPDRPYILGNGDVADLAQARERVAQTGCDGVMIGRGIFGNPWLFNQAVERDTLALRERLEVMLEHTALYIELLGGIKPLDLMKKHYKAYASGFDGVAELRARLMAANDYAEISAVVRSVQ